MGVDPDYLRSRIREAREAMRHLLRLTSRPFEALSLDEKCSMRYHIVVLAEAIGSICIHICLRELNYEPESYPDCLSYLGDAGLISCVGNLIGIVRLRNLLVHKYWVVDDQRVYISVRENFKCVLEFLRMVEDRYGL